MKKKKVGKKARRPKRIYLGDCFLGERWLKVYAITGQGDASGADTKIDGEKYGEIRIGIDYDWGLTLGSVWHEFFEMECLMSGHEYDKVHAWSHSCEQRIFAFNHDQFMEICKRCGDAIQVILDELIRVWKKWSLAAPKKKKRKKK